MISSSCFGCHPRSERKFRSASGTYPFARYSEYLNRDRANPFLSSHHVRYLHGLIVDDNRTMICWEYSVRLKKNRIIYLIGIELDTPSDEIIEYECFILWYLETYYTLLSICNTFLRLLDREMTTVSIIPWRELELLLLGTECRESLWSTETIIRSAFFTELMESRRICVYTFWLDVWPILTSMTDALIGNKSEDIVCIEDRIYSSLHKTSSICILHTDNILSLIMMCPEITIESSSKWSDMEIPSWWWCETGTNDRHDN